MEQITMVQIEQLHPHEQNPRIDAASVADLTESIREHGIEVPLVAAPADDSDTAFVVLAGHRRLTAAHALGLTEVPVQVRGDLRDARDQLALMATENLHRDNLTAVEEARLVQDMLNLGMTQAEVARQTALGKQRVRDRVRLSKLAEDTGQKVHRGQITVDDALIIAEYSDDPDAVEQLEQTAGTHEFDYKVSEARRAREDRQRITESRKVAKKRDLRIADDITLISDLVREGRFATDKIREYADNGSTGDEWDELLIAEHSTCPGHCATILDASTWVTGYGSLPAGTLMVGCDQWDEQHPDAANADDPEEPEEPEPEHDPWEDLAAEDFSTAKIHRERHLATTLPTLDTTDITEAAFDIAIRAVIRMGWGEYHDDELGIELLQAITGQEGKTKVRQALRRFPLPVLIWLGTSHFEIRRDHRSMTLARPGSTYWGKKSPLRQLLEHTAYEWTPVEQQAILLATGIPHDANPDASATDGAADAAAALAEGGEVS